MKFILSFLALVLFVGAANAASCDGNCGGYAGGYSYTRCSCQDSCRFLTLYEDCCSDYDQYCIRKRGCIKPARVSYTSFLPDKLWYKHGESITYKCSSNNYGIDLVKRTCEDGSWTRAPTCRRVLIVVCKRPELGPKHASFSPYKRAYVRNSLVTYTCKAGCQIAGNGQRKCTASGSWTGLPTCQCGCKHFGPFLYGSYSPRKTTWAYDDVAQFSCGAGYELYGRPSIRCYNGAWNSPKPSCRRICREREHPDYGSATLPEHDHWFTGSTVTYSCNDNYRLKGYKTATCRYNGHWSHDVPTCARTCNKRRPPAYGKGTSPKDGYWYAGDTVTYKCQDKYRLRGFRSATCRYNGAWTHPVPQCVRTCPDREHPAYGYASTPEDGYWVVGNTVTYTCQNDYRLSGSASAECRYNGVWSHPVPTCIKTTCPSRADPANGRTSPPQDTWNIGNVADYACGAYYDLVGSQSAECLVGGVWSANVPTCVDKSCADRCTAEVDSDLPCQCFAGCLDTDLYKCCPDAHVCPLAHPKPECPVMPHPEGGHVLGVPPFYDGMVVIFVCNRPLVVVGGYEMATCKDGRWDHPAHTCARHCGVPQSLPHGQVFGKREDHIYKNGHEIYYACEPPYRLPPGKPVFQSICTNGVWKPSAPTCRKPINYNTCKRRCGRKPSGLYKCDCRLRCAHSNSYLREGCCPDYKSSCIARGDPY